MKKAAVCCQDIVAILLKTSFDIILYDCFCSWQYKQQKVQHMETFDSSCLKNCSFFPNSEGDVLRAWMKALCTSSHVCEQGVGKTREHRSKRPGLGLSMGLGKR